MHLGIALGGVAGALARHAAGTLAAAWWGALFPWGTLLVNLAGAGLLGFLMRLLPATAVRPAGRAALTVGFCGGFTTFSTFAFEAVALGRTRLPLAAAYVLASVLLCLVAVAGGMQVAGVLVRRRGAPPRTVLPLEAPQQPGHRSSRRRATLGDSEDEL